MRSTTRSSAPSWPAEAPSASRRSPHLFRKKPTPSWTCTSPISFRLASSTELRKGARPPAGPTSTSASPSQPTPTSGLCGMALSPEPGRRRSIRLPAYDYSAPGAYFVTICAARRRMLFHSPVVRESIEKAWRSLPNHFPLARIDQFVVMPNHVHGIIVIRDAPSVVAQHAAPKDAMPVSKPSLGVIVRSLKSATTKQVHELGGHADRLWQP